MNETNDRPPRFEPSHESTPLEDREYRFDRRRGRSIFWGITLIVLGLLFTVDKLDLFETMDLLRDWWPVLLIAFGIASGAYVVAGVGVWLLIGGLGLYGLTYSTSWPVILIIAGAGIIVRAATGGHRHHRRARRGYREEER